MRALFACLLMMVACMGGYAQVCNGSLGDPLVKVDFGAGPTLQSANIYSDVTSYNYTSDIGVEDGFYSIKNSTIGDHPGGWWQTGDHTGDPGGYMMVVNASFAPGEFFRKSVTGLCPNTTYEFAAWVLNLLRGTGGIRPNITFTIQSAGGTKTFDTGAIPNGNPNWVQYGTFFRTPANSGEVTIIMTNNAPGGSGNDLCLDDITFRACGPVITSKFVSSSERSQDICVGDNATYNMSATAGTGYTDPVYQWQTNNGLAWEDIPGATDLTYTAVLTAPSAGNYRYRISAAERSSMGSVSCRINSDELTINVNSPPSGVIIGPDTFCEGQPIAFQCALGDSYEWTYPDGSKHSEGLVSVNSATLANAGTYTVKIIRSGCITTTSHNVTIIPKVRADAGADRTICVGGTAQLNAVGGASYRWSPAAGLSDPNIANPLVSVTSTTSYIVRVTGQNNCFAYDTVMVYVDKPVTATAGPDKIISAGQSVVLEGVTDGRSFYWSPADGLNSVDSLRPVATPAQDITYTLYATSGDPCNFVATDQVFVRVFQKVIIPNTFTPNNDGVNDTWNVAGLSTYPTSLTQIFDRQGSMVFQTQGYGKPWDGSFKGKPLPAGVYYYKIDLGIGSPLQAGWLSILR